MRARPPAVVPGRASERARVALWARHVGFGSLLVLGWFVGVMGSEPLWLIAGVYGLSATVARPTFHRLLGGPDLQNLRNSRLAVMTLVIVALVYVTGYGPALLLLWVSNYPRFTAWGVADPDGRISWRWCIAGVVTGQVLIATGVLESYVPQPAVHVLATLVVVLVARMRKNVEHLDAEVAAKSAQVLDELRKREDTVRLTQALIGHSADVLLLFDAHGRATWVSDSIEDVLGFTPEERLGQQGIDEVHPDDREHVLRAVARAVEHPGELVRHEVRMLHADGSYRWHAAQVRNLLDDPGVGSLVVAHHDITDRKQLEQRLTHQAFHDSLTGLPNRTPFFDSITAELAADDGRRTAVVVVDLDDFKDINDTLGHQVGDELLRQVAQVLLGCLRGSDQVARLGGDEFALLLTHVDDPVTGPVAVAERVLERLRSGLPSAVSATASIGIATTEDGARDCRELMNQADLAMYAAKQRGKGRVAMFEPSLSVDHSARLELADDLARAVATGEGLHVAYQPVVDLRTGRIKGVEALARWRHPVSGDIPPGRFIPVAEANGMVVPLGLLVLHDACRAAVAWRALRPDLASFTVSVNLSARQLESPSLLADVEDALRSSGLPPANLQLEVTETVLVEDAEAGARVLRDLKALGVSLALDDFGTGYSSLRYLNQFPLDVIKIDRSFVSDVHVDEQRTLIVETVLALAHGMGMGTIAEGIEQPGERDHLLRLGCQGGQGYLFARPQPPAAITELLANDLLSVGWSGD